MITRTPVGLGAAAALAFLIGQGYYAGHRPLPHFRDHDVSFEVGPTAAPLVSIVALGDSTLTGPGLLDPRDIWIHQVLDAADLRCRVRVTSLASGGAKVRDVRRRQLRRAVDLEPDIAVVAAGSNDTIRMIPGRLVHADLDVIVTTLRNAGASVLLAGVGDLGTIPRLPTPLAELLTLRSARADRLQHRLATGRNGVVKAPMREIATEPFRTEPDLFSPDMFHPNARGQAIWADAIGPTLRRMISTTSERKHACAASSG